MTRQDRRWSQTSLGSINEIDLQLSGEEKLLSPQETPSPAEEPLGFKKKSCKSSQPDFNWKVRLWVSTDSTLSRFLSTPELNSGSEYQNLSTTNSQCMQLSHKTMMQYSIEWQWLDPYKWPRRLLFYSWLGQMNSVTRWKLPFKTVTNITLIVPKESFKLIQTILRTKP